MSIQVVTMSDKPTCGHVYESPAGDVCMSRSPVGGVYISRG